MSVKGSWSRADGRTAVGAVNCSTVAYSTAAVAGWWVGDSPRVRRHLHFAIHNFRLSPWCRRGAGSLGMTLESARELLGGPGQVGRFLGQARDPLGSECSYLTE